MTTIILNDIDWEKVNQYIDFLNYLIAKSSGFFNVFKNSENVKQNYLKAFKEKNCVFIPINNNLSLWDKVHLKKPENLLKYQSQFENYIKVIKVEKATLRKIDEYFAKYFNTGYKGADDIFLLDKNKEYAQFEQVLYAINSSKLKYYKVEENWFSIFKNILTQKISQMDFEQKDSVKLWMKIGTSAIKNPKEKKNEKY